MELSATSFPKMGVIQLLSLIVNGCYVISKGLGNIGKLLGFSGRLLLFWIVVWGFVIAAFIIPRSWWKNAAASALEWATERLNEATTLLEGLYIQNLAVYWEALGEPFEFSSWIFDLPFAFNIIITLSGLWLLAFVVKIVRHWSQGKI